MSLLSVPLDARMVSLWGDHWTCNDQSESLLQFKVVENRHRSSGGGGSYLEDLIFV